MNKVKSGSLEKGAWRQDLKTNQFYVKKDLIRNMAKLKLTLKGNPS